VTRGTFTRLYAGAGRLPVDSVPRIRRSIAALGPRERAFIAAAYDEEIAFVDREIDRLLGELARRGVLRTGLTILTADHGEEFFEHGGFEHGHSLFQELLHVPFVVWGRDIRPERVVIPISLVDVVPTVLEFLGLPSPADLAGVSLWPLLTGVGGGEGRALMAEGTLSGPEQQALIEWPYKLIDAGAAGENLYDLAADGGEVTDIRGERSEVAARMSSRLREVVASAARRTHGRREVALDPPTVERLRALGYLE